MTKSLIYSKVREYNCRDLIDYTIPELEIIIKDLLDNLHIKYVMHDRKYIKPQELDFYLPKYSIAIEVNDTYSHNSTFGSFGANNITPMKYHQNKVFAANKAGIRLIHLYEWDLIDSNRFNKIKQYLIDIVKYDNLVYARKCRIEKISKSDARNFYKEYHLQGAVNNLDINYGLYYENELISCMSFGKPRFSKNCEYELLRYANKYSYRIIGGAEKLFKHFIEEYCPNSIISYCDIDKFSGQVYEKLGFKFNRYTAPTFNWTDYDRVLNWKVVLDKGPDKILGTNYGKGTSNEEIMIKEGFVKVYNSGNKVYIWNKS